MKTRPTIKFLAEKAPVPKRATIKMTKSDIAKLLKRIDKKLGIKKS